MTSKEKLIAEAVSMGLGDEAFLKGLKEDNLLVMVDAVRVRDGKIKETQKVLSKSQINAPKEGVTTVSDLLRAGAIGHNNSKGETIKKKVK